MRNHRNAAQAEEGGEVRASKQDMLERAVAAARVEIDEMIWNAAHGENVDALRLQKRFEEITRRARAMQSRNGK
jgi:hypothetical protein